MKVAAVILLLYLFILLCLAQDDVHIHVNIGKEMNKNEADFVSPSSTGNKAPSTVTEATISRRHENRWWEGRF